MTNSTNIDLHRSDLTLFYRGEGQKNSILTSTAKHSILFAGLIPVQILKSIQHLNLPRTSAVCGLKIVILASSLLISACGGSGGSGDSNTSSIVIVDPPKSIKWTKPTTYSDGSPLTGQIKLRLYYGGSKTCLNYVLEIPDVNGSYRFDEDEVNTIAQKMKKNREHFFALTVVDSDAFESAYSEVFQHF